MNNLTLQKKYILLLLSFLITVPFIICFGLNGDEAFTMGMINLPYETIIHTTSLDIHPPLYYIVLKLFLTFTTFWTKNIFIKIIFARIFSAVISIVTFFYLVKISTFFKITYNKYLYFIIFLLFPLQLGIEQQFTNIRMYSLSILLFSIEVYYLVKYLNDNNNKYFIAITVSTIAAMYTNYMCGLMNCSLLLIFFIDSILKKESMKVICSFISGIISILLFLPWIPNLLTQLSLTKYDTLMTTHSLIKFLVILLGILFVFMIPNIMRPKKTLIFSKEILKIRRYLYITLLICLLAILVTKPNAISLRYVAPVITLIMFTDSFLYVDSKHLYNNHMNRVILTSIFSLFLILNFAKSLKSQITTLDIPSYHYIQSFRTVEKSKEKSINANKYGLTKYPWNHMGGNAIYLQSIDKSINDKHYVNMYDSLGNGNEKLFKTIYYNIQHPYRKHF